STLLRSYFLFLSLASRLLPSFPTRRSSDLDSRPYRRGCSGSPVPCFSSGSPCLCFLQVCRVQSSRTRAYGVSVAWPDALFRSIRDVSPSPRVFGKTGPLKE